LASRRSLSRKLTLISMREFQNNVQNKWLPLSDFPAGKSALLCSSMIRTVPTSARGSFQGQWIDALTWMAGRVMPRGFAANYAPVADLIKKPCRTAYLRAGGKSVQLERNHPDLQ
jgi:hypothetical protein